MPPPSRTREGGGDSSPVPDSTSESVVDVEKPSTAPYAVPCCLEPYSPPVTPLHAGGGGGPPSSAENEMVDSLLGAFREAEWPMWSTLLLGVLLFATAISIIVLIISRAWRQPPPALSFLRQSQCPVFLGYTENQQAPFTLWLPSCTVVTTGKALACETDHDCVAVGAACASATLRAAMQCAAVASEWLPDGALGSHTNGGVKTGTQRYCLLSFPLEATRRDDTADGTVVSSTLPFCLKPTSRCAMCRTSKCPEGHSVGCVTAEQCRMDTPWMCLS